MKIENNLAIENLRRLKNSEQSRIIEVRKKIRFEVHIVEHCNLNCKYCFHFSPIAKEEFLLLDEYESDIKRLSDLFNGVMHKITLLGGEPLLHPKINEFIKITREKFPEGEINILTNGILLPTISDDFWINCNKYNIEVLYTKYPIKLDIGKIESQAQKFNVKIQAFNMEDDTKKLIHEPIDVNGGQPAVKNFYDCYRSNLCITLKHGKLYTCLKAAHMHLFNDYFDENIKIDKSNGIDIYEAESGQKILEYLTKPIPMCAYCDRKNIKTGFEWGISNKEKIEWV